MVLSILILVVVFIVSVHVSFFQRRNSMSSLNFDQEFLRLADDGLSVWSDVQPCVQRAELKSIYSGVRSSDSAMKLILFEFIDVKNVNFAAHFFLLFFH